jgi:general stress protein 26
MNDENRMENIQKLSELIKDIQVAMLTTMGGRDGLLHSRPMMTQQSDFDGNLWFITRDTSPKANEVLQDQQVNVSYADPKAQRYVSISGMASIVRDNARLKALWKPIYKTWFPNGLDDPELVLLKVDVHQAEYWDAGSNKASQVLGFIKGLINEDPDQMGENRKLTL